MSKSNWELKLHDNVEDPFYEITNGPISLVANCGFVGGDDAGEDAIFKRVTDTLNESGIDFHSENRLEFAQHIRIMELESQLEFISETLKSIVEVPRTNPETSWAEIAAKMKRIANDAYWEWKNDKEKNKGAEHEKIVLPKNVKSNFETKTFRVIRAKNGLGISNLILVYDDAIPDIYIGSALLVPLPQGMMDPHSVTVVVDEKGIPIRTNHNTCIVTTYIH